MRAERGGRGHLTRCANVPENAEEQKDAAAEEEGEEGKYRAEPPTLECIRRWGVVEPQIYITLVVNPYSMCVAAVFESFFRKLHKHI